jgi:6,7-dimethyl-8-ribityllumazine synthase
MSGAGAPNVDNLDATGLNVVIVAAQWNAEITDAMLANAEQRARDLGANVTSVRVPGAFELPVVSQAAAEAGADAVIALGVVVRGGTPHFDYVCAAATDGLTRVALETGVPVGFGVLTTDDQQQAFDRSGLPGSHENKGREAAEAAISAALAIRSLQQASVGWRRFAGPVGEDA